MFAIFTAQDASNSMPKSKSQFRYQKLGRLAKVAVIWFVVGLLARNWIAKVAIEHVGTLTLGTPVSVGKVDLGFNLFRINDVKIQEPQASSFSQVKIGRIEIEPTLWRGIQDGVWCENIFVAEPSLHIRFDSAGKLASRFPVLDSDASGEKAIPLRSLTVNNANLFIYQDGKEPISFQLDLLNVEFGDRVEISAAMKNLIGGVVKLHSSLDANSFAGATRLEIAGVHVDTAQVSSWPLVPREVAMEPASAIASLSAVINHPPDDLDLRNHGVVMTAKLQALKTHSLGEICEALDFSLTSRNGIVKTRAGGDILNGRSDLSLEADVCAQPLIVNVSGKAEQLEIHQLKKLVERLSRQTLPEINLTGSGNLNSRIVYDSGSTQFEVQLSTLASGMSIDNVSVDDLTSKLDATGSWTPSERCPLEGKVSGSYQWDGLSTLELAKRYDLGTADGVVTSNGNFDIQLANLNDPNSYRFDGQMRATDVAACGLVLDDSRGQFQGERGAGGSGARGNQRTRFNNQPQHENRRIRAGRIDARLSTRGILFHNPTGDESNRSFVEME